MTQTTTQGTNGKTVAVEVETEDTPQQDFSMYGDNEVVVEVTIDGISPMLQHAMTTENIVSSLIRRERTQKDVTKPLEVMAREVLYYGPKGELGIPPGCLFACLREAGRSVKFDGRKSISTADSTMLPSILAIEPPITEGDGFIPFIGNPTWVHDVRRGNLKGNGKDTAVGIVRPRFDKWSLKTRIVIIPDGGVTEGTIRTLFSIAGRRVGLCSFRPEKNGQFGRFQVSNWVVLKDKKPEVSTPDVASTASSDAGTSS